MSIKLYEGFDFRKKDGTIRIPKNIQDEIMEIDNTEKPFSSMLEKWKVEGDHLSEDVNPLAPKFNFYDKYGMDRNSSSNAHKVTTPRNDAYDAGRSLLTNNNNETIQNNIQVIYDNNWNPEIKQNSHPLKMNEKLTTNALFDRNPGFVPNTTTSYTAGREVVGTGAKHYKQNYQFDDVKKSDVQNLTKNFEKPLNGVIQPDARVVQEYRSKYITTPKDNFDWLRQTGEEAVKENSRPGISEGGRHNYTYRTNNAPSAPAVESIYETATIQRHESSFPPTKDIDKQINRPLNNEEKRHSTSGLQFYEQQRRPKKEQQKSNNSAHFDGNGLQLDEAERLRITQLSREGHDGQGTTAVMHFHDEKPQRTGDGWSKTAVRDNYIPGPSTLSLQYFPRTNNTIQEYRYGDNQSGGKNQEEKRRKEEGNRSSKMKRKSSKKEKKPETDVSRHKPDAIYDKTYGEEHLVSPANLHPSSHQRIFSPTSPRKSSETNMDQLNFTRMSANVRRSKSNVSQNSLAPTIPSMQRKNSDRRKNSEANRDGSYLALSGHGYDSHRSRSTLSTDSIYSKNGPNSNLSRNSSFLSTNSSEVSHLHDRDKASTTVMLAKDWSGKIISTSHKTEQVYDYGMNVHPPQLAESGRNLHGLVFRNNKPFNDVKPFDDRDYAMQSLHSLDRRLKHEDDGMVLFKDSLEWMYDADDDEQADDRYYRESHCEVSTLPKLSNNVQTTGWDEGQNMRVYFYHHLHKITTIVNQMILEIPKKYFPFSIKPLSFQGEFEKKGKYAVDLYLVLQDIVPSGCHVVFTLRKGLSGYVVLDDYPDKYRVFCAQDAENGTRVLSANNLMLIFTKILDTKIRSRFESGSKRRKGEIPFNTEIEFKKVSDGEVRLLMFFPEDNIRYDVGLHMSLNVSDFPNVIDSYPDRKWPNAVVKNDLVKNGVHLLARFQNSQNHSWNVTFLKTRKVLLSNCDTDNVSTSLLLALQVINDRAFLNRGCSGLLPVHFIMILFWSHVKYRNEMDWKRESLGQRFIDLLIALKRCLQRRQCRDFFFPTTNYLQQFSPEQCHNLALNVQDVLDNPSSHVKSLLTRDEDNNTIKEN